MNHSVTSDQYLVNDSVSNFRYSSIGYPFWQYWIDVQDPRTKNWFLVDVSPYTIAAIMSFYLYFALKLGPAIMKDRKPFDLKYLILTYNIFMACANASIVWMVIKYCDGGRRFFIWKYPDRTDVSDQTMFELNVAWWYYMSKYMDLLDTIFFVLRKKQDTHITFLHLYHHTSVPIFGYLCMKHNAIMPITILFGLINGTIHTIMYTYFALTALGPSIRKYLWWKRYITQLQLGQFIFGMVYGTVMIFKQEGYPQFWFWFGLTQPFFFFKMFYDFYRNSYKTPNDLQEKEKKIE